MPTRKAVAYEVVQQDETPVHILGVRAISLKDQQAIEHAPFFDALCQMLAKWAREASSEQKARQTTERGVAA